MKSWLRSLSLAACALMVAGCQSLYPPASGAVAAPSAASLQGTRWLLEDLAGRGVLDRLQSTLAFGEPGRVSGQGGCNLFNGAMTLEGDRLALGPLVTTRRACEPAVMDQETRYLAALAGARRLVRDGPWLLIHGGSGDPPLRFTQMR